MIGPLVSVEWLRETLSEASRAPHELRVVDCRFVLGDPDAPERLWREAHIPGAAFMSVDRDLAAPPGDRGRHPLPDASEFEAAARRAGIGPDTLVVAYDEAAEGGAARLWWLLRHFGHADVTVLDGGLRAWREAGGPMQAGDEAIPPGDFRARPRDGDTASIEDLAAAGRDPGADGEPATESATRAPAASLLLDARAPERYRGETEPIDSVAGHIPGARNLPFVEVAPGGRFLPPDELRARFEGAGAAPGAHFVAYCGSGVTACVLLLAAKVAGLTGARLYPGSWSEWSRRGLPAEDGESPARH